VYTMRPDCPLALEEDVAGLLHPPSRPDSLGRRAEKDIVFFQQRPQPAAV
jgi:hypothetical protein